MNLKKIVAAGIAAVCAVSMAACGGSGDSSKVTDMQYKDIKLGETGKDIKANLKLFSHRTDMLKKDYPGTLGISTLPNSTRCIRTSRSPSRPTAITPTAR